MTEGTNPVLAAIRSRRSIRQFTGDPVPDDVVRTIVEAAQMAPSGGNRQMCRFCAIRRRETLSGLREAVEKKVASIREHVTSPRAREQYDGYAAHFSHFDRAPVVIAVMARPYDSIYTRIIGKYLPEGERPPQHLVDVASMSVAAAIENMLLAAHALGYGACFMTGPTVAQEEIESLLGVEKPWHVVALVPVGRPKGSPSPRERIGPDEVLSFD